MAIYFVRTLTKSVLAVLLVASLSVLSATAQIQNPIQAAKDAYNKAKQQQQRQNGKPRGEGFCRWSTVREAGGGFSLHGTRGVHLERRKKVSV